LRLFTAISIPEDISNSVFELSSGLPDVRSTLPENIHLTLNFIGDANPNQFLDITESLYEVGAEPFSIHLEHISFFDHSSSGVLYVGVSQSKELLDLQKKIHSNLIRLNLKIQKRTYTPHVTFARFKEVQPKNLFHFLQEYSNFSTAPFVVDGFHLYSSVLKPQGSVYTIENSYPL
jgi:RNA 2',3'-cyclic 3'-phosphodiesterase